MQNMIDICICTFRRTHVAETIYSISRLFVRPGWTYRIIVADNDNKPSAFDVVEAAGKKIGVNIIYIYAPSLNISIARNACLDAASAPLVAFIDDDEEVSSGWLEAMISCIERSNADVVLGPVHAIYDKAYPRWIREGDFHSTKPVFAGNQIITGYSGNVIMRRSAPSVKNLRFRPELGTGGEDTAFFSSVYKAGGTIVYAPEAIVTEAVVAERARLGWLLRRCFRTGKTHGALLMEEDTALRWHGRIKRIIAAFMKTVFCFTVLPLYIYDSKRAAFWLLRGTMHVGILYSVLYKSFTKAEQNHALPSLSGH